MNFLGKILAPILLLVLILVGCTDKAPDPVRIKVPTHNIDYQKEVKPILDKRCVVCHSCYNSPCQLKLSSFEGVDRGATKEAIYNTSRLKTMDPTRLFTDAQTTEEWRKKDFFSVTTSTVSGEENDSIMIQLLSHKMKNSASTGEYYPEATDLTCSKDQVELGSYLKKHPNRGMPFGFPPLKQEEFDLIGGWLVQGAKGPSAEQQQILTSPKEDDARSILQWESFLNQDDPKHAMTARYLYEHLFLAHLNFGTGTKEFYEIVRSRSGPGEPIDLIATVRPYDDPGVDRVFYRFRKIYSTIVYKTHMVFDLDEAQFNRFQELFIKPKWLQEPHLVNYEPVRSANPFATFEQIPPRSRYQFLLDNAHYTIMTFIRGPVCKGQVALNVIDDHFWVMFLDPDHDLSLKYPAFLKLHINNTRMPIEKGSDMGLFKALSNKYHKAAVTFSRERQNYYMSHNYDGLGYDAIWKGNDASDTPLLTVYRHFDSASAHKGVLGELPKTLWVIDYPLFERIYYALVAGFDVYGNVGHQLSVRLYMDALRVEGESYFLDFLPKEQRIPLMQSWYEGVDLEKINYFPADMPAKINFTSENPKREFVEYIVNKHIEPSTQITFDPVNYFPGGVEHPPLPDKYETPEDYLQGFRAVSKPGTSFFSLVNNYNANLIYVRLRLSDGKETVISIVINRWHNNVAYLFGEGGALDSSRDRADFIKGFIGSYPNYFFDVHQSELPDFFDLLMNIKNTPEDLKRFEKYGINRANNEFWGKYDWFQERFNKDQPVTSGLFDLNRYYFQAR